jgi:hypothetical protein
VPTKAKSVLILFQETVDKNNVVSMKNEGDDVKISKIREVDYLVPVFVAVK